MLKNNIKYILLILLFVAACEKKNEEVNTKKNNKLIDGILSIETFKTGELAYCLDNKDSLHNLVKKIEIKSGILNDDDILFISQKLMNVVVVDLENAKLESNIIPKHSFSKMKKLEEFTLPSNTEKIGDEAFLLCTRLHSFIVPANTNLKEIGISAFAYCPLDKKLLLPNTVERIEAWAFAYTKIKAIKFANKIQAVSSLLFDNSKIESVDLPETIELIGKSAFQDCQRLRSITVRSKIPPRFSPGYIHDYNVHPIPKMLTFITLKVPESSIELYKKAPFWKDFMNIEGIK